VLLPLHETCAPAGGAEVDDEEAHLLARRLQDPAWRLDRGAGYYAQARLISAVDLYCFVVVIVGKFWDLHQPRCLYMCVDMSMSLSLPIDDLLIKQSVCAS
jgi:hypothetical protein